MPLNCAQPSLFVVKQQYVTLMIIYIQLSTMFEISKIRHLDSDRLQTTRINLVAHGLDKPDGL